MGNNRASKAVALREGLEAPLNYAEAAKYLGCRENTLRCWVSHRRVPHIKVGALCRFRRADLDAWLAERSVPVEN